MKLRTLVYISIWLSLYIIKSRFELNVSQTLVSSIMYGICQTIMYLIVNKVLFNRNVDDDTSKLICFIVFVYHVYSIYNQKIEITSENNKRFYIQFV